MLLNKELVGTVYKITNKINKKVYIGITTLTIETRWKQHVQTAMNLNSKDSHSPFKKAIRKYGPENFTIEPIDYEYENEDSLRQKEQYWIKFYNSCCIDKNSWGYNCTRGGDCCDERQKISIAQCDIVSGDVLKIFKSIKEAERYIDMRICSINTFNATAGGYCWLYTTDIESRTKEELRDYIHSLYPTLVYQLDNSGKVINIFKNCKEAAKAVNTASAGNIISCCLGNRRQAMGYQWCYQRDLSKRLNLPLEEANVFHRPVVQYGLNGKKIQEWESAAQASSQLSISDSHISSCCHLKRAVAGGYQWRFKSDAPSKLKEVFNKRPVICIETGEIFPTPFDAAKKFNYSQQTVKNCCIKGKTQKPFHFRWKDD